MARLPPAFQLVSPFAKPPARAHPNDVGWDLYACHSVISAKYATRTIIVDTGVIVRPPPGHYVQILPLTGFSSHPNSPIVVPTVLEPDFRRTIKVVMKCFADIARKDPLNHICSVGDPIAQLVFLPYYVWDNWIQEELNTAITPDDSDTIPFSSLAL